MSGEPRTLLDAAALRDGEGAALALVGVATGRPPIRVSRARLRERVRTRERVLAGLGARPRTPLIVALDEPLELVYTFWAALRLGVLPVLYPGPGGRSVTEAYAGALRALVDQLAAGGVIASDPVVASLAGRLPCPVYPERCLRDGEAAGAAIEVPARPPTASDLAYIQASSGTTGARKAVPVTHDMVLRQLASYGERLALTPDDVVVNWMPLFHDGGLVLGAILPVFRGFPAVLLGPTDWVEHPSLLFRAITDFGGTLCTMPNFAFSHCACACRERDLEGVSVRTMRAFVNGSERVFATSFTRFLERFAPYGLTPDRLAVAYGLAENTLMAAHTPTGRPPRLDHVDRQRLESGGVASPVSVHAPGAGVHVSCGPPLDGTELRIVDEAGQALPERQVGEVALRGAYLFGGYYGQPPDGGTPSPESWFRTGDLGYLAEGELYVVGRSKDVIITRGRNLYPADLEELVSAVPGVRPGRAVVFGVADEADGTERIAVVAEVTTRETGERAAIEREIRRTIAEGAGVAASYVDLPTSRWVIKTSSGKVARAANREKWLAERGARR